MRTSRIVHSASAASPWSSSLPILQASRRSIASSLFKSPTTVSVSAAAVASHSTTTTSSSVVTSTTLDVRPILRSKRTIILPQRVGVKSPSSSSHERDRSEEERSSSSSSSSCVVEPKQQVPRYLQEGYEPLSVSHPAFGQQQAVVRRPSRRPLLSTVHPAFGTKPKPLAQHLFRGPVHVSGFFLAIDPTFTAGAHHKMNPNCQLTIRDADGNSSRVRYRCLLEGTGGLKFEAMVRFQVGWVSPRVTFSEVPNVIHLGRGFDVSVPFLFHFTMVSVLDERGCATGSSLYFSGTPMMGLSIGMSRLHGGRLVLDPKRDLNPEHETQHHFIGHIHYRQAGFVVFKMLMWIVCALACLPPVRRFVQARLPDPLMRFSEMTTK